MRSQDLQKELRVYVAQISISKTMYINRCHWIFFEAVRLLTKKMAFNTFIIDGK